jgi:hypothetical protein
MEMQMRTRIPRILNLNPEIMQIPVIVFIGGEIAAGHDISGSNWNTDIAKLRMLQNSSKSKLKNVRPVFYVSRPDTLLLCFELENNACNMQNNSFYSQNLSKPKVKTIALKIKN